VTGINSATATFPKIDPGEGRDPPAFAGTYRSIYGVTAAVLPFFPLVFALGSDRLQ
jgi:hypothetical protein